MGERWRWWWVVWVAGGVMGGDPVVAPRFFFNFSNRLEAEFFPAVVIFSHSRDPKIDEKYKKLSPFYFFDQKAF